MLAVLCMLITSMPMVVTADEIVDEVTGFTAEDRVVYVNKDATTGSKKLQSNDPSVNNGALWADGVQNQTYNKKVASNGTEYLQFESESENWVGANNLVNQPIKGKIYNQKKLTVETWISIDDIDQAFVSLFATTKGEHDVQNNGMWQLYVENSKLKHKYNDTAVSETDLIDLEGQFMHVVITRDVQDDKIVLETIVNGESKGTKEFTEATLLENPDGDLNSINTAIWFFGGFRSGKGMNKIMNFSGRVGEMNVYQNVMSTTQASTLYNRDIEKYNFAPDTAYAFKKNEKAYWNVQNGAINSGWVSGWLVLNEKNSWTSYWNSFNVENKKTVTGLNGDKFSYFDFVPGSHQYVGSDNINEGSKTVIRNQPETTVEAWVSVDDIAFNDSAALKTIFYTGMGNTYSTANVRWHIYVQDGKIKQVYDNNTLANEIDIKELWGKFIHVVATRKVDSENSKITYDLYVNGNKATTHERTGVDATTLSTPDGSDSETSSWFMGGIYYNKATAFVGKMAEFNVYNKVADNTTVSALYDLKKDVYDIGTDTDRVDEAIFVRENKVVSLNKDYTDNKWFYKITGVANSDYGTEGTWSGNSPKVVTGTNVNGKEYTYFDYTDGALHYNGGNDTSKHAFLTKILNKPQTTIETWISVDDIMAGRVDSYRNIFYFANVWNQQGSAGTWSMFVQNGQLKQTYENGKTACADIALGEYAGKFIHVVATRNIEKTDDGTISKITYQTYLNGKAQTPVVLEAKEADENGENGVTISVTAENNFFLGGIYQGATHAFVGKIAEFNMFDEIMSKENVEKIYNAEKDKYDVAVESEYTNFKNAKALYLNKEITAESPNYLLIPSDKKTDGAKQWNWSGGMKTIASGVNKDGETYNYYPFTADTNSFMLSDNYTTHYINNVISDKKNLSVEMWIAVDDIMADSTSSRQIFGTGSYDVASSSGRWQLLVKGGKLVHSYKGEVIDEIDIAGYKSEFVHVVLTRDVNDESISFNTYFNGEKQTGKDITVSASLSANPDGAIWTFGNGYQLAKEKRFVGKIADIVVYQDVLPEENATTLYNETKDIYASEHIIKVQKTEVYANDDAESEITNLKDLVDLDCSQLLLYYKLANTSSRYTKHAMVTVALYDGNKLVDVTTGNVTLEPGKTTDDLKESELPVLTITLPKENDSVKLSENSSMKFFVWSTDEGENMQPCKVDDGVDMEWKYLTEEGL